MHSLLTVFAVIFVSVFKSSIEICEEPCLAPTLIYYEFKCIPAWDPTDGCCPKSFDCSNIYERSPNTCHFKGKFYKPGEIPDTEDTAGLCTAARCECTENGDFKCISPSDGCGEFWVPGWVKPGCYLKYKMNKCCSAGQNCGPDDQYANCTVNSKTYKEGQRFDHPTQRCTQCICDKDFDEKHLEPLCKVRNCTTELRFSKEINNHCAPVYRTFDNCCPDKWICPSQTGTYTAAVPPPPPGPKCQFGEKEMLIGEKYKDGSVSCECIIPPYLSCKE